MELLLFMMMSYYFFVHYFISASYFKILGTEKTLQKKLSLNFSPQHKQQ